VLSRDRPLCRQTAWWEHIAAGLEKHADFLLALIEVEPDLTLDEVICAMGENKIPGSRTALWRFFQRHKITFIESIPSDNSMIYAATRGARYGIGTAPGCHRLQRDATGCPKGTDHRWSAFI
jgi:hypothetical protein